MFQDRGPAGESSDHQDLFTLLEIEKKDLEFHVILYVQIGTFIQWLSCYMNHILKQMKDH